MPTSRLEAFSDGVMAVILTIMVLEIHVPEGHDLAALASSGLGLSLLTYLLSFLYVGIYWNNHHHMFQIADRVTGGALWANLHLLFWLSLLPLATAWLDESSFARIPAIVYGVDLLALAVAYFILQAVIIRSQGTGSTLRSAVGRDLKGKLSPALYIIGIVCAVLGSDESRGLVYVAVGFFAGVAVLWLVPDRRIERRLTAGGAAPDA
ncbi:MAG TPA: TMEM175 family protein [Arthrobacter sp.]|nr:TMEM175 family protein [Arthrobacter sp.]